ncbi:hypothetical protein B0H14DRAFT_2852085 [Mycena olivaceomarginata]|nr:hypothetical protein B0H14DRAFT_2852085 [Mycena olivaceomarginata]
MMIFAAHNILTTETDKIGDYNTKISEPMHRPLRDAYHNQTNFKNVQPQILRSVHRRMVGRYIREQLGDARQAVGNVVVGSKLPATRTPHLQNSASIIPYQFLKVFLKSLENWLDDVDFLRCNPCFHGLARYDAALVKTTQGNIFVRLVYVFTFEIDGRRHPFALVQALDVGIPQRYTKDRVLSLHSIIRGALLVPDFEVKGDHIVVDLVDADMYFRIKAMYGDRE